jgi:hypothetical protein
MKQLLNLLKLRRALPLLVGGYAAAKLSGGDSDREEEASKLVQDYMSKFQGAGRAAAGLPDQPEAKIKDPRIAKLFSGVSELIKNNSNSLTPKDISMFLNMVSSYTLPLIQYHAKRSPFEDLLDKAKIANYLSSAQARQAKAATDLIGVEQLYGLSPMDIQQNYFSINPSELLYGKTGALPFN